MPLFKRSRPLAGPSTARPRRHWSKRLWPVLILVLGAGVASAQEVSLSGNGIAINAGTLGQFTLDFPALLDAGQKPICPVLEKTATGPSATLKYEGGAQLDMLVGEGGSVSLKFSHLPGMVKSFVMNMQIPIAYNQGGKWKIADKEADFPKVKPAQPHLFQGNAPTLTLTNYEGKTLVFQAPLYSFLQLTDNREWNWDIFHFKSMTPLTEAQADMTLSVLVVAGAAGTKAQPLVDQFGQSVRDEWPDKLKSLPELQADVAADEAYYASLTPPATDPFGGLPKSQARFGLKATGFFHVEKKAGRWLLVDPIGNAFFHLGLCSVNPGEDYTLVKGRETAYAWLPPKEGEFASVFRPDSDQSVVSFHLANWVRKFGQPYSHETYTARMIARMRKWGFNSMGAFSSGGEQARAAAQFPSVAALPLNEWDGIPRIPNIGETFDPFDEKIVAQIEANFAKTLPGRAKDPLLIGYFLVNEPIYENIPHILPTLKGSYACKRRLVKWLAGRYPTVARLNAAWDLKLAAFDELNDLVVPVTSTTAKKDIEEFTGVFLEEYFRVVTEAFRRYDQNHLLIGNRLQPGTINNEQLCRIAGKYLDVMSFNYYTLGLDKELLERIYRWSGERPMILSEFYWSSPKDSSLSGGRELGSQQERGLAYRNYVEGSAGLGFVVGIEWFTLIDQSFTGRWFQGFNGERANTGVLSVTDRPWKAMLSEMMKTNYSIYALWLDRQPPFVWKDPRFVNKP